ncbi:MAG: tyrosine-type recombinase/integrase [Chloroflexi bacterium]|nr:tyrosine-type recombinase/integrase [Chloroflexota bacterium]
MLTCEALDNFLTFKDGATKKETVKWYRKRLGSLRKMYGDLDIAEVKPEHLDLWRADIVNRTSRYETHPTRPSINTRGLSVHTQHGYIRAARTFFRFCLRREYIERNPAMDLGLPPLPKQPPKHITNEDIDQLLLTAKGKGSVRDYALVIVLSSTGCRIGGLEGLRWDQVDLDAGIIKAQEKFDHVHDYYLIEDAKAALRNWREECKGEIVFPNNRSGAPLTYYGLYQIIKRLAKKGGVSGRWNPHSFRHHKARELLNNGASLEVVADILHHGDVTTTVTAYARWTKKEVHEKHGLYSRQKYPEQE